MRRFFDAFAEAQQVGERSLRDMLRDFNDGRSKRYYGIAAAVLEIEELERALIRAREDSAGLDIKDSKGRQSTRPGVQSR